MKSRVTYKPGATYNYVVEYKKPGLFGAWYEGTSFTHLDAAIEYAKTFQRAGVMWDSASDGGEKHG